MSKIPRLGCYTSLMRVFGAFRVTEAQFAIAHHGNQMLVAQIMPMLARQGCKLVPRHRSPGAEAADSFSQGCPRGAAFQGCKKGCKLKVATLTFPLQKVTSEMPTLRQTSATVAPDSA